VFRDGTAIALLDFDYAGLAIRSGTWQSRPSIGFLWPIRSTSSARLVMDGAPLNDWSPIAMPTDYHRLNSRLFDAVATYLERGRRGVERRVEMGEQAFVDYWQAGLGDRLIRAAEWVRARRHSLTD
jgi:hypothetical protein